MPYCNSSIVAYTSGVRVHTEYYAFTYCHARNIITLTVSHSEISIGSSSGFDSNLASPFNFSFVRKLFGGNLTYMCIHT